MIEVGLGVSRGKYAMQMRMHRMREILLNADKDANAFDEIWEWMRTRILTKAFASMRLPCPKHFKLKICRHFPNSEIFHYFSRPSNLLFVGFIRWKC